MAQKPLIFISHITEEKEIASALKSLVESTFLGMIQVFVSSDPMSIKMGRRWLDEITDALSKCAVEIILASPSSVHRPWINFEAGAGWIRKIPLIPVCHSGMTPSRLPAPLVSLLAATANKDDEMKRILPALAEAVGSAIPEVDFSSFVATVEKYEKTSKQIADLEATIPLTKSGGLSDHEIAALVAIGARSIVPDDSMGVYLVKDAVTSAGFTDIAVTLALQQLSRKGLVEMTVGFDQNAQESYAVVRMTEEGWQWIRSNEHLIQLKRQSPAKEVPF